jgi:hypothetical protein
MIDTILNLAHRLHPRLFLLAGDVLAAACLRWPSFWDWAARRSQSPCVQAANQCYRCDMHHLCFPNIPTPWEGCDLS